MSLDLEDEVDKVVSELLGGAEPRDTLIAFAKRVQQAGVTRVEKVNACKSCGASDECFRCKAKSVLGEQVFLSAPVLIAKIGPMIKEWAMEARAAKRAKQKAEAHAKAHKGSRTAGWPTGQTPPPPPGPQTF